MTEVGIISLVVLAFTAGAIAGVIIISLCFANSAYEESEASYKSGMKKGIQQGRDEIRKEMEDLCSHCTYRRVEK